MAALEIVAHRGAPEPAPENTVAAFEHALALGADLVELDVRLTRDRVPVVYHWTYLDEVTSAWGPIFEASYGELQDVQLLGSDDGRYVIPTLEEVLDRFAGRIGLEIELKGPELEAAGLVAGLLQPYRRFWDSMEVTSYEPVLLLALQRHCPGLATDLLCPRSEPWMGLDAVAHRAIHMGRAAQARAVHLHPSQLSPAVTSAVRAHGLEIHSWDVNDLDALQLCADLGIPRLCTDRLQQALGFRQALERGP